MNLKVYEVNLKDSYKNRWNLTQGWIDTLSMKTEKNIPKLRVVKTYSSCLKLGMYRIL